MSKEIKGVGGTHGFQDKCTVMELPKLPSSITMLVDMEATLIFLGWFVFQAILAVLPIGRVVEGQPLRSGERLKYRINGKCAFCWLLIFFFWGISLPLQEIWVALSGYGTAAARAALPIPVSVFHMSKQWCGCQCLGLLICTQTLMHAIAHGGCVDMVRESTLEVSSGRKIPCHTGDLNPYQYCAWLFIWMLYQLSYPHPLMCVWPYRRLWTLSFLASYFPLPECAWLGQNGCCVNSSIHVGDCFQLE